MPLHRHGLRLHPQLLVSALLLQLPLIFNPGYYSHDELQWAARAVGIPWHEVQWVSFLEWSVFQYRPITFNLWMLLSRWFFETPYLMHAACVVIGTCNALLLNLWARQLGASQRAAFITALVWILNPYAMMTHGWVGTIADSLWVLFALIGIVIVQHLANTRPANGSAHRTAFAVGFMLTLISLLCKEAALVVPAAFLLSWFCLGRTPSHLTASCASALAVGIYLLLRLAPMLSGSETDSAYSIRSPEPLQRWAEYLIFPALLQKFEPRNLLASEFAARHWLAVGCFVLLTISLLISSWRLGLLWLLAPVLALAPALVLPASHSHYAYGASIAAATVLGMAASTPSRATKVILALWLMLTCVHGVQVAAKLQNAGAVQAELLKDINALRRAHPEQPLRIVSQSVADEPLLMRSLHSVPSYLGFPWGVQVVAMEKRDDRSATHLMHANGQLEALTMSAPHATSTESTKDF